MPSPIRALVGVLAILIGGTAIGAAGPNPDKYPLRVYIFRYSLQPDTRHTLHPSDMTNFANGIGQADLFEGGEPRGFQFSFACMAQMTASAGYQTFPARWKKREAVLEILLPQKGKPDSQDSCDLQPVMNTGQAYFWKNGEVAQEPSAHLKAWMVKHKFDPENSAQDPVQTGTEPEPDDPLLAP